MAKKKKKFLFAATWNVRSLVESSGDIRVCRAAAWFAALNGGGGVDRKLDLLVDELGKYRVDVAGLQETKWFGSDVWWLVEARFCILDGLCQGRMSRVVAMKELGFC